MPATYEPIATTTLGSAASTITFSSIPSTYTDLRLVFTGTTTTTTTFSLRFNNDTNTNYSFTYIRGNGASASSSLVTSNTEFYADSATTTTPSFYQVDVFSYTGSSKKTFLVNENNDKNGSGIVCCYVGLWSNTSSVNRLDIIALYGSTNTFASGTTATLYGILKA